MSVHGRRENKAKGKDKETIKMTRQGAEKESLTKKTSDLITGREQDVDVFRMDTPDATLKQNASQKEKAEQQLPEQKQQMRQADDQFQLPNWQNNDADSQKQEMQGSTTPPPTTNIPPGEQAITPSEQAVPQPAAGSFPSTSQYIPGRSEQRYDATDTVPGQVIHDSGASGYRPPKNFRNPNQDAIFLFSAAIASSIIVSSCLDSCFAASALITS